MLNLPEKVGKNVVEALRELNGGALFYGKLVTNDSWRISIKQLENLRIQSLRI